jgi:hypothetical protein
LVLEETLNINTTRIAIERAKYFAVFLFRSEDIIYEVSK